MKFLSQWEPSIKKYMGSLGDSGAENGGTIRAHNTKSPRGLCEPMGARISGVRPLKAYLVNIALSA